MDIEKEKPEQNVNANDTVNIKAEETGDHNDLLSNEEEPALIDKSQMSEKEKISCQICGKIFKRAHNRDIHMRTHTGEKPYSCEICWKAFSILSNKNKHMMIHTGEKPYSCEICGKSFPQLSDKNNHMRVHTGEKPYSCDICTKSFSQPGHKIRHMRTHTGDKPYSCEICGKAFSQSGHKDRHMRTHTGEKPYSCEICNKTFSVSSNKVAHMRLHTGEKPYSCEVCGKLFSELSNKNRHVKTHTDKNETIDCDPNAVFVDCGMDIKEEIEETLDDDHFTIKEEPVYIDVTPDIMNIEEENKDEETLVVFNSDQKMNFADCEEQIQKDIKENKSLNNTGNKPYPCDICGKSFARSGDRNVHKRTHTGEKPFSCDICGKAFTQSSHKSRHMKTHKDKIETTDSNQTVDYVDCGGNIKEEVEETLDDGHFTMKEEPVYMDVTPDIMDVEEGNKEEETLDDDSLSIKEEPAYDSVNIKEEETGDYLLDN